MKTKLLLFFIILTVFSGVSLFAQAENNGSVYVIREIEYDISGRTRPFALFSNGEFKYGERITGIENLDIYIADKRQLLMNQRVLEEVEIEYSTGGSEEDGDLPVKLLIHATDSFNFVILPYPKYDSNDGLSITLKMRDYNFLGTMSALRVDLGYESKSNDNTINFVIDTDIPFQAFGLDWSFNFDHEFKYTFGKPLFYQNVTGVSLKLPWELTTFTVGFNQYITVNEENSDDNIDFYGLAERYYGPYAATELFANWKIPFGIFIGSFGEIAYTPGISGKISYPYGKMDEPRKPVTTFSHSLGFGRIDWIGNLRKGLSVSLSNDFSWYFDRPDVPLEISLSLEGTVHKPFSKYFGISSRLSYRQWWRHSENRGWLPYYSAGDLIRGVLNDDLRADYMVSLNVDFPIRVLRFWPSEWFNKPKLHFFDFEMFFSPFMDFGLVQGPYNATKKDPWDGNKFLSLGDMIATAGMEVIVFPAFFRSFYIRASLGYNLRRIKNEGFNYKWGFFPKWDEIFIGVDHHY